VTHCLIPPTSSRRPYLSDVLELSALLGALALPSEAPEPTKFKDIRISLGKSSGIDLQSVSVTLPKPLEIVERDDDLFEIGGADASGPFQSRLHDTIDRVRNAGRAPDLENDQDEAPEAKKDRTAAARQRRCRKKQRQHDSHGVQTETGVTERDSERDGVTTAPALPQLDLQNGGQNQALTH